MSGIFITRRKGKYMKTKIGLWIDHRKAVIVAVSGKGEETSVIESKVENSPDGLTGYVRLPPMNLRRSQRMVDRI